MRIGVALLTFTAALGATGCSSKSAGPLRHESRIVERDQSEVVHVNLNRRAGELRMDAETGKLLAADFDYNVPEWKPDVSYKTSGGIGYLTLNGPEESGGIHFSGNQKNDWNIHLSPDVPLEVTAHLGAGDARLNLGGLALRVLEVTMIAGDLDLDLRGTPKSSYTVHLSAGAGESTVHLPDSIGVEATATSGIGGIEASGLHSDGLRYFNDLLGKSKMTVHLDIQGGVGSVKLIL